MTFLETADRIGARICRDAIWSGDRCNWIGCHAEGTADYVHRALGPALYSGAAGIALVLFRLYDATGERIFRLTADGALRQAFSRREPLHAAGAIGFFDGLAGIAYAAGCAGGITGDEGYAGQAIGIARGIEPCPGRIDIMNGSAGAIPALLAMARLAGGGGLVEVAARHAQFLIARANRGEGGWSWTTMENCHGDLTGFGHGAAGIAFALLEMFHATGDRDCRDAAIQGFRYERGVFRPEERNWPDYRGVRPADGKAPCAVMWCAGAPGIGLSRLRAGELLGDPVYLEEAQAAMGTTLRWLADSENGNYSLCHGIAGNVELLLESGEAKHREIARRVGQAGMERYEMESVPWPCGNHHDDGTPDLMLGLAGIAHFYLRLHDARKAPSVLMVTR